MPTQASSTSPAKRVLDRIIEERFTGLLRVSSHEASGEFWFLAGILEEARFGVSKGEEARERLLRATQVVFQAELRLPYVNGGFKRPMPTSGTFAEFRPVTLMRHCESYALTCSLELRGQGRTVRLTYRTGELLSADAAAAGNDALPTLLESEDGSYEFVLPPFELPEGVNAAATSASRLPLAERIDRLLAEESAADADTTKLVEPAAHDEKRKADQAAAAEAKRKAAEAAAAAESKRKAEEAAALEVKRKAEAAAAAESKRKAEEAVALEAKRNAAEAAAAEAKRKADEAAAAEAKRKAEEATAAAEAERKAAEAKRKAAEASAAAEAKQKAIEGAAKAKRERDEFQAAAAKSNVDAEPKEALRPGRSEVSPTPESEAKAVERRAAPALSEDDTQEAERVDVVTRKGGFPWFWLFLALLLVALAYFTKVRLGLH